MIMALVSHSEKNSHNLIINDKLYDNSISITFREHSHHNSTDEMPAITVLMKCLP